MATIKKVEKGTRAGQWRLRAGAGGKLDKYFKTKISAQQWLNDHGAKVPKRHAKIWTLEETFLWLKDEVWAMKLERSTIGGRTSRFEIHIAADWGEYALDEIDPVDFQEWIGKVSAAGVGLPTVQKIKSDLVTLWNEAVKYGRVPRFIANPFMVEVSEAPKRKAVVLAPEQFRELFRKADDFDRTFLALGFLAGLRIGEIQAFVRPQRRDGYILVDRAVKARPEAIGLPKRGRVRQAVVCETLRTALDRHPWRGEYCFRQQNKDYRLTKKQVYALWSGIKRRVGLPAEMGTHDMRLNHINWIEKLAPEISDTTLREHVGHSTSGVTQTNYTRPLTVSQQGLARAIDRIVGIETPSASEGG